MNTMLVFAAAGLGTYLLRSSMVWARDSASAGWVAARTSLVGPAVLAAIVVRSLAHSGAGAGVGAVVPVAAVVAAMFAARRTGNVAASLAVGLPIYWMAAAVHLV